MSLRFRGLFALLATLSFTAPMRAAGQQSDKSASTPANVRPAPAESDDDDEPEETKAATVAKPDPSAAKFWEAVRLLKSSVPAERTAGMTALKAVSDLKYVHAQTLLAGCYLSGSLGFPKDQRRGFNLFRLAAERGNGFAMLACGALCAGGVGTRVDDANAIRWLEAALAPTTDFSAPVPPPDFVATEAQSVHQPEVAGSLVTDPVNQARASAHYVLGVIAVKQKKLAKAQEHFVASASTGPNGNSGYALGALLAAINYALGTGVPKDAVKANEMLERSRKLGTRTGITLIQTSIAMKMNDEFAGAELADAMNDAGVEFTAQMQHSITHALVDKKAKTYDPKEAVKWYQIAAENGQIWAMLPLLFSYLKGENGPPDPKKAFYWFQKAGGDKKSKDVLSTSNLAICYFYGIGTAPDQDLARQLFKKYRRQYFLCYLGDRGISPKTPLDLAGAIALTTQWAKEKKDATAQYFLAVDYYAGYGVESDLSEAERWMSKAAKAGQPEAMVSLGAHAQGEGEFRDAAGLHFANEDFQKALEYYQKASAAGYAGGPLHLARMYHEGHGVKVDLPKAELLYLQALQMEPEDPFSHYYLGRLYETRARAALTAKDSVTLETARAAMLEHYEAAAKLDSTDAMTALATLYYQGEVVKRDFRKAYTDFESAAANGSPGAHFGLGLMHEQGEGVPVTYTEAAYHYRLAALDGHVEALRRLVNFYITGQGVSPDLDRAQFWLAQMVRGGNSRAYITFTDVLLKKGEYDTALKILDYLRDYDDEMIASYAYDRLAYCYANGYGVKANPNKAKKYTEKAIKHGNGNALTELGVSQITSGNITEGLANLRRAGPTSRNANYVLGMLYYFGNKVPKDENQGLGFMREAAEANHPDALYFLATLTYNHKRGAPTLDQAIDFSQRAATAGHANAGALRDALEKRRREPGVGK